jgi:hypothetical protein
VFRYISLLTPIDPQTIRNAQDLFGQMRQNQKLTQNLTDLKRLIHQKIFHQFSYPAEAGVVEGTCNADNATLLRKDLDEQTRRQLSIIITLVNNVLEIRDHGVGFGPGGVVNKAIEILPFWLETLAHELVHIKEETDCKSSHDGLFDKKLVVNLIKLLFKVDDPENIATILEECCAWK